MTACWPWRQKLTAPGAGSSQKYQKFQGWRKSHTYQSKVFTVKKGWENISQVQKYTPVNQTTKEGCYCTVAHKMSSSTLAETRHPHDHYVAAATIEPLARVKAAINDPSCSLSLHAMLNLYLRSTTNTWYKSNRTNKTHTNDKFVFNVEAHDKSMCKIYTLKSSFLS